MIGELGEIYTPSLAQLANHGLMLTNFHVAAYCAPTRSMLMTGADNHVVGLGNMIELMADNQVGRLGYEGYLNGRAPTLATMLRDAGYHTYMAGKWHLGKTPELIPAAQGFEDSVGVLEGGADNWESKSYSPGYKAVHFFDGRQPLELPAGFYSSSFYADRMIRAIDSHAAMVGRSSAISRSRRFTSRIKRRPSSPHATFRPTRRAGPPFPWSATNGWSSAV